MSRLIPVACRRLFDLIVDVLAYRDRLAHIAVCSACQGEGPLRLEGYYACEDAWSRGEAGPQSCPPGEWTLERLSSGAAVAEALFLQVQEIRFLPSIEPKRVLPW